MTKTARVWATALAFGGIASSAMAGQNFAGIEAGITAYHNFSSQADQAAVSGGFATSMTAQDKRSSALGIYGGQWITDKWGWEVGYTDLGYVNGSTIATAPPASSARIGYKFSATALYASVMGGMKLSEGTLYARFGLYNASVKYEESVTNLFAAAFTPISATNSSNGWMAGAGYSLPLLGHLSGRAELGMYSNVKFHQVYQTSHTSTDNLYKLSIGLTYAF